MTTRRGFLRLLASLGLAGIVERGSVAYRRFSGARQPQLARCSGSSTSDDSIYVSVWERNLKSERFWLTPEDYRQQSRLSAGTIRVIRKGPIPVAELLQGALEASGRSPT